MLSVKGTLWIGTADINDLYINIDGEVKPLLAVIAQLIRRGVEVFLIHAKEPGQNFREDFGGRELAGASEVDRHNVCSRMPLW